MKTYAPNQDRLVRREPAATRDKTASGTTAAASWKSPHSERFDALQRSPRMVAQRQALRAAFGERVQLLQAEGEENPPLQGKGLLPVQRMEEPEDEELIQGKRTAVQLQAGMDDDELPQGQFSPAQLDAAAALEAQADAMGQKALQRKGHGGTIQLGKKKKKRKENTTEGQRRDRVTKPKTKIRKYKDDTYTHTHASVDAIFAQTKLDTEIQALDTDVLERYVQTLETSISERAELDEQNRDRKHIRRTNQERKRLGRLQKELAKRRARGGRR